MPNPAAYEKLVDRLLASPAYGERMAWDWLDAARYADSNSATRATANWTMWPWRRLGSSMLSIATCRSTNSPSGNWPAIYCPTQRFEQRLATGFCRNHMINGEGGRIPEENRVDYVMDMSETTGTVWLGLTFNCCRCHDHKFDPLTQTEYYQLFAFFNQTPVDGGGGDPQSAPQLAAPTAEEKIELAAAEQALAPTTNRCSSSVASRSFCLRRPDWERQVDRSREPPGRRAEPHRI